MIVMLGMVGAGKTVQARRLAERHGWHWLSSGEILRASGNKTVQDYLRQGKLLPDKLMEGLIVRTLENLPAGQEVVFDGFPRRTSQATWLDDYLQAKGRSIEIAIHLTIPAKVAEERLQLRGRSDDTKQGIVARTKEYQDCVVPLLDYYKQTDRLCEINALGSVQEIGERLDARLTGKGLS